MNRKQASLDLFNGWGALNAHGEGQSDGSLAVEREDL